VVPILEDLMSIIYREDLHLQPLPYKGPSPLLQRLLQPAERKLGGDKMDEIVETEHPP